MMYLLLLLGFVLLIKGADFFVEGSSSVARIFKIPSVIIGLTIVAMGTSAPEAAVSITAGLAGNSDISLSNIVGSNIFNLLVVIGVCAIICPVKSHKDILARDLWWNAGATVLLFAFIFDHKISWIEGVLLLLGIVSYLIVVVKSALKNRTEDSVSNPLSLPKSCIFILGGLAAIIIGGNLVVNNSSLIAAAFGMSDTLIGLTIVAVGTSLPELVTSITAAKKGDSGIALGNAVGSCIFNILFILGISSTLTPINVSASLVIDTAILIVVSILIFLFAKTKKETNRVEGVTLAALYVCYLSYIIYTAIF